MPAPNAVELNKKTAARRQPPAFCFATIAPSAVSRKNSNDSVQRTIHFCVGENAAAGRSKPQMQGGIEYRMAAPRTPDLPDIAATEAGVIAGGSRCYLSGAASTVLHCAGRSASLR